MIVKMSKVYIVSGKGDRDRLLNALRDLGVVHLIPVDADTAVPDDKTIHQLDAMKRAIQILSVEQPSDAAPDIACSDAADETLNIYRGGVERRNRLTVLHRHVEQQAVWGDVRLEDIEALKRAGVEPKFYYIPPEEVADICAELVLPITVLSDKRLLVAVVQRGATELQLPDSAEEIELPDRDRPTMLAEAAEIDATLKSDAERLRALANLLPEMHTEHNALQLRARYAIAQHGGLHEGQLFAVQGWSPADEVEAMGRQLSAVVPCAVQPIEPAEDEEPPSLVRYPRWARPIEALFKILNTTPGYREYDLSPFFMIAMPIFTAMLIGDAGYGAIFTLVALLFRRRIKALGGRPAADLVLIFGAATVVWGLLTANVFGVSPPALLGSKFWKPIGDAMLAMGVLWRSDPEVSRTIVMKISFVLAVIHLVVAHLRKALGLLPHQRGLAELGWCAFLVGMFGLIWLMFFPETPVLPVTAILVLFAVGAGLFVLFGYPSRNPFARIGIGLLANIMPMINTFGDTLSYIRLMAVGLASYYIASAFNALAWDLGEVSPFLIIASVLILIFAHSMNIALCLIAIFAHGVRLNMLEFSNNADVQWAGYPYAPFAVRKQENQGVR